MTSNEIHTIATKIFKDIKDTLTKKKKEPKVDYWQAPGARLDIEVSDWYDGIKLKKYIKCISVEGKEYKFDGTDADAQNILFEVRGMLDCQKKTRGWANLMYTEEVFSVGVGWNARKYRFLNKVILPENPCKEYKSLQSFINKYGKKVYWGSTYGGVNLGNFDIFHSAMGGKRGTLWDEYGDRMYLDNRPKKCVKVLEELRKNRGNKDIMVCEFGEENWIDPTDRRYSEMHEVECEGEKRHYLEITIKTPTGRVKYETKIY